MNSGIYASYIYTFTLRNQILQGLIKRFYSSACFIGVFFSHVNIHLVGFTVEIMALPETFA